MNLTVDKKVFDPDTGRQIKKAGSKGTKNRRVIKTVRIGGSAASGATPFQGYEFTYHATRGWRKNKI